MTVPKGLLLIDDDPDDQLFFGMPIQVVHPDLLCELASNCQEAFKQLELPPPPDYIFMDLNMPVMNGFDCLALFKKSKRIQGYSGYYFHHVKESKRYIQNPAAGREMVYDKTG